MSRQVVLLAVLAKCHTLDRKKCRPGHVKLERARPSPDSLPLLFRFIGTIVAFYSMKLLPIYLASLGVVGRGHKPHRRGVVIEVSLEDLKRCSRICRGIERDMRSS